MQKEPRIAERLALSPGTFHTHTVNIYGKVDYRKIDVRGRAEAVAYAVRHGLVAPDRSP